MAKRALCFLLSLIMTTSILFSSVFAAAGEEITEEETVMFSADESDSSLPFSSTTTPPNTVSTARFPAFSVSVISNYFGKTNADYNEYTKEFTIRFTLQSSKALLSVNWSLSYDSDVLKIDPSKNTLTSICPTMSKSSTVSFDEEKGLITFNATDMHMYDFTNQESDFLKIVFDIPTLVPNDTEITKVDLSLEELWVSEPEPKTGISLTNKEICLVKKGNVMNTARSKEVTVSKHTEITPSTFHDTTYPPSTKDQATTSTVKPTEKPTVVTTPVTAPKDNSSQEKSDYKIYTGEWYIALIILVMLIICSTALLIMRKRDIYNN